MIFNLVVVTEIGNKGGVLNYFERKNKSDLPVHNIPTRRIF